MTMKSLLLAFFCAICATSLFAQVPQGINFEAVYRVNGAPQAGGTITLVEFAILNNTGAVYKEIHSAVAVSQSGLFNLAVGKGTATLGNFSTIDWATGTKSLEVKINGILQQTTSIMSVPYAQYANSVNLNWGTGLGYDPLSKTVSLTRPYQTLSTNGNTVTLSNGGSFNFPTSVAGNGIGISGNVITNTKPTQWEDNVTTGINYTAGNVGIGVSASFQHRLSVDGTTVFKDLTDPNYYSFYRNSSFMLTKNGVDKVVGAVIDDNLGVFGTSGLNGSYCRFSRISGLLNNPYIALDNATSSGNIPKVGIYIDENGKGKMAFVENSTLKAGIFYDATLAKWTATASIKSFREPHPTQAGKEIWYACIEGREAAMYVRGTARLVNGKATVEFPEDFTLMAVGEGMTAMTTPNSADSKGMAVTRKTTSGIEIQELGGGTGNYTFDWEVKAVRKGFENFKVVRDAIKGDAIDSTPSKIKGN